MRQRIEILTDLLNLRGNLHDLLKELSIYDNYSDDITAYLSRQHVINILRKAKEKTISFKEIEEWAIELRKREDVEFENETVHEIMSELANPELFGFMIYERLENLDS